MLALISMCALFSFLPSFQNVRITDLPVAGMVPPIALVHPKPFYTMEALSERIEGTVTIRAAFDDAGNLRVLEVLKKLGHGLDESALVAIQQWRFAPALRDGERVSVIANVDVDFHFNDAQAWPIRLMDRTVWVKEPAVIDGAITGREISIE